MSHIKLERLLSIIILLYMCFLWQTSTVGALDTKYTPTIHSISSEPGCVVPYVEGAEFHVLWSHEQDQNVVETVRAGDQVDVGALLEVYCEGRPPQYSHQALLGCTDDQEWNYGLGSVQGYSCVEFGSKCHVPEVLGARLYNGGNLVQTGLSVERSTVLHVRCHVGRLRSLTTDRLTCLGYDEWQTAKPRATGPMCVRKRHCRHPENIPGAMMYAVNRIFPAHRWWYGLGERLYVVCLHGSRLLDTNIDWMQCGVDRQWSGPGRHRPECINVPTCQMRRIAHATVTSRDCGHKFAAHLYEKCLVGGQLRVECFPGFELHPRGAFYWTCLPNGRWLTVGSLVDFWPRCAPNYTVSNNTI